MEGEGRRGRGQGPGGWSGRSLEVVRTGGQIRLFRERTIKASCARGPWRPSLESPCRGKFVFFTQRARAGAWKAQGIYGTYQELNRTRVLHNLSSLDTR